jgi:hypothetical protein
MKYEMINKRFTETVAEWMAKGYHINTATMNGHQGEVAKIDLTNGAEIIRIVLDNFHEWDEDWNYDGLDLIVGRCTDDAKPDSGNAWGTLWTNHLEIISSERFYQIGREKRNGEKWYGTREEAAYQSKTHMERYRARRVRDTIRKDMPEAAKAVVLPFLHRQPKCKNLKLSRVASVEKVVSTGYDGTTRRYYEVKTLGGKTFKIG